MDAETPLTDVAHHLDAGAAASLMNSSPFVQRAVLESVRNFSILLEHSGAELDNIQQTIAISWHAVLISGALEVIERLYAELRAAGVDLDDDEGEGQSGD